MTLRGLPQLSGFSTITMSFRTLPSCLGRFVHPGFAQAEQAPARLIFRKHPGERLPVADFPGSRDQVLHVCPSDSGTTGAAFYVNAEPGAAGGAVLGVATGHAAEHRHRSALFCEHDRRVSAEPAGEVVGVLEGGGASAKW